nr:estrogen sulfotransferase-like [Penaeus vannamei]
MWEKREHPNLHIVFYEDLKADVLKELKRLNEFLGTGLTEAQLGNVQRHTSFGEMKAREATLIGQDLFNQDVFKKEGGFFRKGQSGDWKGKLTPELEAKVDQYVEQKLGDLRIPFRFT